MSSHVRPPPVSDEVICAATGIDWTWLNSGISVFAIAVGAWFVKWQVEENARKQLWQTIYREIAEANQRLGEAEVKLSGYVRQAKSNFKFLHDGIIESFNDMRAMNILDLVNELNDARHHLMMLLETYEITSPQLKIFHTALNVAFHDLSASFMPVYDAHLKNMPIERDGQVFRRGPFNDADVTLFEQVSEEYIDKLSFVGCFCFDLIVEAQNLLLGGVFKHRVPRREPADPKYIVVRLDQADELNAYFENDTDWGREKKQIEESTRQENA